MAEAVAPRPASTILLLRDSADAKVDGKSREEIEVFMEILKKVCTTLKEDEFAVLKKSLVVHREKK